MIPHYDVLITFVFGDITFSMMIMITTPFGYENYENLNSYFVGFHIYIKSLLNILIFSTAIPYFHFFKKLMFEDYMIPNLTKGSFYILKNDTQNKSLKNLQ